MAKELTSGTPESSDLKVVLVTPTGLIADDRATGVTAPGELGQFEIRPGHVPFLTKLVPGVLVFHTSAGKPKVFAVGAGVLEVDQTGLIRVLCERALPCERVDLENARTEVEATEPVLKDWKKPLDAEYLVLKGRHDWAQAQVDAHDRARA